ncbi:MAG: formate/nitrite transporter family protein [Pseudomonadota bacterium]
MGTKQTRDPAEDVDHAIKNLSAGEARDAVARAGPGAPVIYASISARGVEELNRPALSLWGSGISAGLLLMMSVLGEGLFHHVLPAFEGASAIADIGYTFGFVLVIMGRLQLFTENTITPVLPLLANPTRQALWQTARLWLVVFCANLIGTFAAALLFYHGGVVTPEQLESLLVVSSKVMENTPLQTLLYGVVAGLLIAALVWCMPTAAGGGILLIVFVTYMIALGNFTHVIAGSGEGFLLLLDGQVGPVWLVFGLILPALIGNVLGGTVLFAILAYVQVKEEISAERADRRTASARHAPAKSS